MRPKTRPPRASSHPFFASARFAWSSDAPFDRDAMTRELLDAVQDLARRCERRGRMERLRDALRDVRVIGRGRVGGDRRRGRRAAVDRPTTTTSLLNECILTARGIKCLEAMARSPLEGIEAAVLLSEHATHTAAPDDDGRDAGSGARRHAWVGTMYAAAAQTAALRAADEAPKPAPSTRPV